MSPRLAVEIICKHGDVAHIYSFDEINGITSAEGGFYTIHCGYNKAPRSPDGGRMENALAVAVQKTLVYPVIMF